MSDYKINAMYYDRELKGCQRLLKNSKMIENAANGLELNLTAVNRAKRFPNEKSADELLLQEEFLFDAVIINGNATDAYPVLESAIFAIEYHSLPSSKIIYLYSEEHPKELAQKGMNCVETKGGNGHLTPQNAKQIINILANLRSNNYK